jgi:hypothetical protein
MSACFEIEETSPDFSVENLAHLIAFDTRKHCNTDQQTKRRQYRILWDSWSETLTLIPVCTQL